MLKCHFLSQIKLQDSFFALKYNNFMTAKELLSANLKSYRDEHHLSQDELALMTGLTRKQISRFETQQTFPRDDTLDLLSDKLDMPISSFFVEPSSKCTQEEFYTYFDRTFEDILFCTKKEMIDKAINVFKNGQDGIIRKIKNTSDPETEPED